MATSAGLAIHDGVGCRVLTAADGLTSAGQRWVGADAAGCVWVGSDVGLDFIDAAGGLHCLPADAQPGLVRSGFVNEQGCWIAAARGLFHARFTDEAIEIEQIETGAESAALLLGGDGRSNPLVADAANNLHRWSGESWTPMPHRGHAVGGQIRCIAPDGPDSILIGGLDGFCRVTRSGDLLNFVSTREHGGAVDALLRRGELILAAVGSRLLSYDLEAASASKPRIVLESCTVTNLWMDPWMNAWAATQSHGLVRISGLDRFVGFVDLPDVGAVFSVHQRRGGSLVVGGEDGVLLPSPLGPSDPHVHVLRGRRAWDVLETRIGETIVATDGGVVVVDSLGSVAPYVAGNHDLAERARSLLKRRDGVWIGTIGGLTRVDGPSVTSILAPDGTSLGYVYSLWEDRAGRLWIATLGRGLWRESEDGVEPFGGAPLRENANVYAITESEDGRLAILADGSLYLGRLDTPSDDWTVVALPAAPWAVAFASPDLVLVGSSSGLLVIDALTGELRNVIRPVIGIDKWEFTTSRSLRVMDDGTLLCGITAGLVAVDLAGIMQFGGRPEPYLADMRWSNTSPDTADGVTTVHAGSWRMDVVVRSSWRLDEGDCTIRCCIEGFDVDWPEGSSGGVFRYTSLPVGDYVIRAQVHSPLVGSGPVVDLHRLRVVD